MEASEEEASVEAGGARRGGRWAALGVSLFAFAVGVGRFLLPLPFTVRDPNSKIGHVFGSAMLETVLAMSFCMVLCTY